MARRLKGERATICIGGEEIPVRVQSYVEHPVTVDSYARTTMLVDKYLHPEAYRCEECGRDGEVALVPRPCVPGVRPARWCETCWADVQKRQEATTTCSRKRRLVTR